ncbi:MAG: Cof-type HAD-IIB family hydrolase [Bacillaceae bacterium]
MLYRMLAINIDGTLLTNNRRLTKETKDAIAFVKSKDVYITLFTSRNYASAQKVAKALHVDMPIITHSGAIIANDIDNPIYRKVISEEETYELVKALEYYDCNIRISTEKFTIGNRKKLQSNIIARAVFSSADPIFYPVQFVEKLSDALQEQPVSAPKIDLHFIDEDEKEDAMLMLKEKFAKNIFIGNEEPYKLEIMAKGVSRVNSLLRLANHYQVKLNEVIAIGDSSWDREIIGSVGLGVAMGHAPYDVKRLAKWITRSNNENGVAYTIVEHFRKQFPFAFLKNHIELNSIYE